MNNQEKGDYLLEAISKLESALSQGRFAEYPYRESLRERIKRVLVGTKAEILTEDIQDKYVPKNGVFLSDQLTDKAIAIKSSNRESLIDVFKVAVLEYEIGN
ncbi:hypothetical protein N0U25_13280 [Pseudomonas sivasensis]|uniref:hypothetical protein n=1 Tax=Pseudomonas sivasensis TaxID=1880678 RepID=UPI000F04A261|nr:hypothetical protein [Pseudomonas sivasensis]MCT4498771.1 hypothetical protein [Pseudomonas sivasensis]